jgi:antirestriction protein ArdC
MKADLYSQITDKIIAELENGVRPWMKPWAAGHVAGPISRPLRSNGKPYSGINVLMLWATAMERGYSAPIWMTYKQAQELGAQVRKGEKGTLVVYASTFTRTEQDTATGEDPERQIPFLKGYSVFNVEQIDGLPAHYTATHAPRLNEQQRNGQAEAFFAATKADIRHGGNSAHYVPALDYVQMPPFEIFRDAGAYYATLAHECTHNAERRIMPRGGASALRTLAPTARRVGIIRALRGRRGADRPVGIGPAAVQARRCGRARSPSA